MSYKTVLIIGYVWLEETSGAGTRMLQLIEQLINFDYKITFASAAQKTDKTKDLNKLGILEKSIQLNCSSFDNFISEQQPEIVIFDRFMIEEQFGWRVSKYSPNSIRILDTEDLHCLRKTRQEFLKKKKEFKDYDLLNSKIAEREIASILRCDLSLIISSYEMNVLKSTFKINDDLLLHLPFLQKDIQKNDNLNYCNKSNFIFVGNYLHAPNVDAVLQLKKIWTPIFKQIPDTELHIYGAYPTQQIQQLHNQKEHFIIKGYTEDILEKVRKAKVVLAPIRFGAGIKGKLIEAMQCMTPSVTTNIGSEGMHDNLEWSGIVSDIENFAENAVKLYCDKSLWETSVSNGIQINNTIYNKKKHGKQFIAKIISIKENISQHRNNNFLGKILQQNTINSIKYMSKWIEEKNKK